MPTGHPSDGTWRGLEPLDEWVERTQKEARQCACGCGEVIQIQPHHRAKGIPVFLHGHHARCWVHQTCYHPNWRGSRERVRGGRRGAYFIPSVKRIIRDRDGGVCQRCGTTSAVVYDHIVPIRDGGSGHADNGQLLCRSCHAWKSRMDRAKNNGGTSHAGHR